MKIAVINFSGNVGKSTVARHLLLPRVKGATLISVESINSDDGDGNAMRGTEFGTLSENLMLTDDAIIDVGSSNVEPFTRLMRQYKGSHEDLDLFVVPVVKEAKQMRDTINTIEGLSAIGVEPNRIAVVFNRVEVDEDLESGFYPIFTMHQANPIFTLNTGVVIEYSELYQRLRILGTDIDELLNDKTDWRAKLRESKDPSERQRIVTRISAGRLAKSAKGNLDLAFAALMAKPKAKAKAATSAAQ